jgi:transcriptional regulator with XRE-family HTH domain
MSESFGARLRQRREAQGIALETIAHETKNKLSRLQGLERDDLSHWPGGLFRRSFVRAYAQVVGLDPESAVREFLAAYDHSANGGDPARAVSSNGYHPATIAAPPPVQVASEPEPEPERGPEHEPEREREPEREPEPEPVAPAIQQDVPAPYEPDLQAMAEVCTAFGRIERADEFPPLLEQAARLLDLKGLIVWLWDAMAEELRPALAHGYSQGLLARLPAVPLDSDSITAAAFRSGEARAVEGEAGTCAALVVPLMMPAGCAGALAVEFAPGIVRDSKKALAIRAMATMLAALLAQLVGGQTIAAREEVAEERARKAATG